MSTSPSYLLHRSPWDLRDATALIEKLLTPRLNEFHNVYVTGLSGVIPGAIFCHQYRKQLVVLRKPNDGSHQDRLDHHDGMYIEPYDFDLKADYILLDDFACGGGTIAKLLRMNPTKRPKYLMLYRPGLNGCTTIWEGPNIVGRLEPVDIKTPGLYRL